MSKRFIARPVLESIYRRYPSKIKLKVKDFFIFVDEIDIVLGLNFPVNDFCFDSLLLQPAQY